MLRAVARRTREGPTAGEVGVEEERLTQGALRRIERVEPRLRHLGELGRVEMRNLLAQRRVVAKGKPGLWRRLGPEMHSDTPTRRSTTSTRVSGRLRVLPPSRSIAGAWLSLPKTPSISVIRPVLHARSSSTFLSGIKAALGSRVDPIFTDYGACTGIPLTSPGGLVTLARRHERVGMSRQGHTLKAECSTSSSMTTGPRGLHAPRLSPWSEAACIM